MSFFRFFSGCQNEVPQIRGVFPQTIPEHARASPPRTVAAPYGPAPNDPEALIHTKSRPSLAMLPFVAALAPTSAATMYLPSNRCNTSVVSSTFNHSCCARAQPHSRAALHSIRQSKDPGKMTYSFVAVLSRPCASGKQWQIAHKERCSRTVCDAALGTRHRAHDAW